MQRKFSRIRLLPALFAGAVLACHGAADDPNAPITAAVDSSKSGSTLALPVVGEPVRRGDLILTVSATGQIRTDAKTDIKAEASGTVQDVLVQLGDHVAANQPLAQLDPKPLDLDVAAAQAAMDAAQVQFNTAIATDSFSGTEVTPQRRAYVRAQSGLEGAGVALEKAKLAREHATIRAPFAGVIERVDVARGDHVGSGQDIATVVDLQHLRVEALVLEHDVPLVKVGGAAIVTVAAFPDKPVRGTVSAVLPLVDSVTHAGVAVININGNGELRPGMYADVKLEADRLRNRIIVPTRAVIERDARPLVFVARNGIAEWVYILPGASNGIDTEVLPDSASGIIPLKPGEIVLTDGQTTLTHQAPIRLVTKRTDDQP